MGMRDCLQNVEMHAFFNFFACVVTGRISHAILVFNPCYYTLRRQASKRFDFKTDNQKSVLPLSVVEVYWFALNLRHVILIYI